jgi:tubulin polyglutamylase TTLL1/tubulin monoglycylase TTLL3/8
MKGTTIVQKYITNLLLYQGRKFDIRAYLLCIIIEGVCKFYWYPQGYIRTSSQSFNLKEFDNMIHLTNDAVQSQGQQYGKF